MYEVFDILFLVFGTIVAFLAHTLRSKMPWFSALRNGFIAFSIANLLLVISPDTIGGLYWICTTLGYILVVQPFFSQTVFRWLVAGVVTIGILAHLPYEIVLHSIFIFISPFLSMNALIIALLIDAIIPITLWIQSRKDERLQFYFFIFLAFFVSNFVGTASYHFWFTEFLSMLPGQGMFGIYLIMIAEVILIGKLFMLRIEHSKPSRNKR